MIRWFLLVTHLLIEHLPLVLLTLWMGSNNNKLRMCARHQKEYEGGEKEEHETQQEEREEILWK